MDTSYSFSTAYTPVILQVAFVGRMAFVLVKATTQGRP
jgi:hypothetical protein